MQIASMEIKNLKILIKEKMKHPFLEKFIEKPVIDEEKLFILAALMNNAKLPNDKKKNYIITTMLVQMALDMHDLVPGTNRMNESGPERKNRQLTVLAGDYYSGLYYFLLAEMEDFAMIQTLASAIKDINEYKMKLYYLETGSIHDFIHIAKKIESLLILRVAEFLQDVPIRPVAEEWLIINKLMRKNKRYQSKGNANIFDIWLSESVDFPEMAAPDAVKEVVREHIGHLENSLNRLPAHYKDVKQHMHAMLHSMYYGDTLYAEEG